MDFDFDTGTIYQGLATLDVTVNPPLGSGPANVLDIVGTGALVLPRGTPAERPAAAGGTDVAGMFRYNTTTDTLEYFNSVVWSTLSVGGGTVTSVAATSSTAALTIGGSPITSSGTFTFDLDTDLTAIAALSGTGFAVRTGAGTWTTRSVAGTAGNITVADGDGVAGNATIDLATVGTPVSASFVKITTDTFGRVTATTPVVAGDITPLVDSIYVNVAGDTMTGDLNMGGNNITNLGDPVNGGDATNKDYVDSLANGLSWKQAVVAGTTAYVDLATGGLLTIDGYTVADGDRVLVKNQGTGAILATDTLIGGLGYTINLTGAGPYALDGGSGTGATATFDTDGTGVVTAITIVNPGTGYSDNDVLTSAAFDTAEGGTGFLVNVNGVQSASENGIYIASAGAWVRSEDMDSTTPINEVNGAAVFVENGSTQADTAWVQTATVTTIGTDPIVWAQFGGPGSYTAGNGLTLSGNQFSLTSPVSVANGGTALSTTPSNGQLLIGNGSGYTLAGLTGGTGITITPGAGSITIDVDDTELVTSVTGTANQITASPTVGDVVLTIPSAFIAPGSVQVTTTLTVDTFTPNSMLYVTTGGQVVSTAALTDGQILIGSTGNPPVAGTVTGGTGITVTNGAGTITIDVDNTEMVTSFSAGSTGFTPNTPSYGDVVLAGTLNTGNGGTGLTTLGGANTVLGVNTAGTALEYKSIAAGTGISVVPGAGVLTINNTGVTSVALDDGSSAPIYTITGSPVTTTGTLTFSLNTQTANTVFAGPTTGSPAEPTFRALTLDDLGTALQLYTENPATPTTPTATGANAVAIGSGASATADGSFAEGDGAVARVFGQKAYANGFTDTAGDAQAGLYVLRTTTTDNAYNPLYLDGASEVLVIPANSVVTFEIIIAGRRTDGTPGGAGYRFIGVAKRDATAGSFTWIGNPSKTVLGETTGSIDARVVQNTADGAIGIEVRGINTQTFKWTAVVRTAEVTN